VWYTLCIVKKEFKEKKIKTRSFYSLSGSLSLLFLDGPFVDLVPASAAASAPAALAATSSPAAVIPAITAVSTVFMVGW
jgi:hypothetical protein